MLFSWPKLSIPFLLSTIFTFLILFIGWICRLWSWTDWVCSLSALHGQHLLIIIIIIIKSVLGVTCA